MPFSEVSESRPLLAVISAPTWNAVKGHLRGLNVAAMLEVTEATTTAWDTLQSSIENQKSFTP